MYKKGFPRFLRFGIAKFIFFAAMTVLFVFAVGNIVMYLWNWILPEAIGAKEITFWKAIGLFVLTRILFGGFKSGRSGHRRRRRRGWREKWMNLPKEEREEFKEMWKGGWKDMSPEERSTFKQKWKDEFRKSWK